MVLREKGKGINRSSLCRTPTDVVGDGYRLEGSVRFGVSASRGPKPELVLRRAPKNMTETLLMFADLIPRACRTSLNHRLKLFTMM